jgi:hypothetical protein
MLNPRKSAQAPRRQAGQAPSRQAGQALVELLPSIVIFMLVVSAGLAYFRVLRSATIRQEVVRNLMFAKINNSGTLTSTIPQEGGVRLQLGDAFVNAPVITSQRNAQVLQNDSCFTVFPGSTIENVPVTGVYGAGELPGVDLTTYAVMYRDITGGGCPF